MRVSAIAVAAFAAVAFMGVGGSTASAATNTNQAMASKPAPVTVTVQPGESLSKIAQANNTTYIRLFNANTNIADPDLIHPGDQIRIPAADEQLAERPLPGKVQPVVAAPAPAPRPTAAVAPKRTVARTVVAPSGDTSVWDRLARCESGGNWSINTGNGYYGGLQFTMSSWAAVGGSGNPANASREEQIARGQALQERQGWGAWPACARKLGLL